MLWDSLSVTQGTRSPFSPLAFIKGGGCSPGTPPPPPISITVIVLITAATNLAPALSNSGCVLVSLLSVFSSEVCGNNPSEVSVGLVGIKRRDVWLRQHAFESHFSYLQYTVVLNMNIVD